jgi:hypothetical protein
MRIHTLMHKRKREKESEKETQGSLVERKI